MDELPKGKLLTKRKRSDDGSPVLGKARLRGWRKQRKVLGKGNLQLNLLSSQNLITKIEEKDICFITE